MLLIVDNERHGAHCQRRCNEMSSEAPGWNGGDAANPQFLQAGTDIGTYTRESFSSAG